MLNAKYFSLAAIAGLALVSFAGVANAATSGPFTSATIGPFPTNFGSGTGANPVTNIVLPLFDTNLGTLTGISFTVGGTVSTMFSGQDKSGNPNNVTLTSAGKISLYAPPAPPTASNLVVFTTPANSIPPFPVAANANFGPSTVNAVGSNSVPSYAGSFAPFQAAGGGTITLPVTASGTSSASDDNGNITSTIRTTATAYGSILYTYTPKTNAVPEPGSVAMLVAGGVSGAAFLLRRKRRVSRHNGAFSPYDM